MGRTSSLRSVSSRGQVALPAAWRKAQGIKPGDKVRADVRGNAIVITPLSGVLSLRGFLGKGMPIKEERKAMEEAVARHVLGKD